ncbi:reverse transcriptase domain-containing protein [Tanacetum coccineum]
MSWFSRFSWCGGPLNSGNCRHCTNVSFGDEPVYDSNPNSYNQTPDISNPPSQPQTSSFNQFHCFHCKDPLEDGVRCQRCTCVRCGYYLGEGFCSFCNSEVGNSFVNDSNPNSFNDPPNDFTHPPQPQYESYLCELCGNDSHYGYDCPPRFPLVYEQEPSYNQNFSDNYYPQNSPSFPQQYLCCENCGGPHESFQCQPMNQNYFEPNYSVLDQPPQYSINHQPLSIQENLNQQKMYELLQMMQSFCEKLLQQKQAASIDQSPLQEMNIQDMEDLKQHYLDEMLSLSNDLQIKDYRNEKIDIRFRRECENMIDELKGKFNGMSIEINKKKELQRLKQVANLSTYPSHRFKSFCYDDDDDYDYEESSIPLRDIISKLPLSVAITPDLPTLEPEDSLIMGNEDLSTIPEKESDEFIKSSVEDLVPIPSESEDTSGSDSECILPSCDDFSPLTDDESLSDEDVPEDNVKIYSNPLFEFDDEYISSDINPLFDEVLENIESKDSYVSNLDEPAFLVTPLFDANEDECFDPGVDIDEIDAFLDMDISTDIEDGYHDSEGDIIYLKSLLNLPPEVFLDHDPKSLSDINDWKIMVKVFDPGIHEENFSSTYVSLSFEDRHYLSFTYVIRIFLPYFTYPVNSSPLSSGSEDIIFDPGISAFHFSSLEPVAYEYPMEVLVEELNEKSINVAEVLTIVEEEGDTWVTPIYKYLTEETLPAEKEKTRAIRRKSGRFGLPGEIISDNGKQFRDNPFKDWCEKLCIRQRFASVKHPQANGLVERANRSLGEGIKARLDERRKDWIEEVPHVLWAHRTMIKSSNEDTPFSLTYGTEAVIPAKIGMPTLRTAEIDMVQNDEALEINLDLLEERREQGAICKARSKAKMEKYYNSKVRNTSFRPGDLVYRNNDASHAKDNEKLSPKWEGPYEVTEALGNGAYKLKDRNGKHLPRTWNIRNLKKCYVHTM